MPDRSSDKRESYRVKWWQFAEKRPSLRAAKTALDSVYVQNCGATPHLAIARQPSERVFSHTLAVFALEEQEAFTVLQSRAHETWARFFGSSMKDDLRYTPSDCFQTFPFPPDIEGESDLERAGRDYETFRADVMIRHGEGLTTTYNRFHDPEETDADILRLRELHEAMDRAVLDAYGWTDVPTGCEFLLDYEIEDDEAGGRRRKKPWRYRWPDVVRDDVLARLLELNAERAAAEQRAGVGA